MFFGNSFRIGDVQISLPAPPVVGNGIFYTIGDSNSDGRATVIPTISAGRLYNRVGSSWVEITNQSVANGGSFGSIWQHLATEYYDRTGRPLYLVNAASGGSNFYPDGDTNNWYTTGTLYASGASKLSGALSSRDETLPEGIIINLGINDCRSIVGGAETYANFQTGVVSLFTRLTTDYPGVPIYLIIPGRAETPTYSYNDSTFYHCRAYLRNIGFLFPDVKVFCNALTFVDSATIGAGNGYNPDGLHYGDPMNRQIAIWCNRMINNTTYSNKWGAAAALCRFSDTSGPFADAIYNNVTALVTSGDYEESEGILLYCSPSLDERDNLIDLVFLTSGILFGSPTVDATSKCLRLNGSSQYTTLTHIQQWFDQSGSNKDNYWYGWRIKNKTTASGVSAMLCGRQDPTNTMVRIGQSIVPSVIWYPNRSVAETDASATSLAANTLHSLDRSGTTTNLLRNTTVVDTASVASAASPLGATILTGAYDPSGGATQFFGCDLGYEFRFSASANKTNVYTALEAILAAA